MVDKEKELGLFENHACDIQITTKAISVFDSFENYIVIGDDKGTAICYQFIEKTSDFKLETTMDIHKGKIDHLKCHATLSLAFFLISGHVYVISVPKLEKIHKSELKDIYKFTINIHPTRVNEFVFITKKRIMKFYEYSHEPRKFIESKYEDSLAPDIPETLEWYKDWMILLTKKKSVLIGTNGKKINIDFDMITYAKAVGSSWLMYMNGTGIFMDKNIPKPQDTIDFGNKPLVSISIFKNFVISLHDSILKVFDSSSSVNIQDVLFEHGSVGRFLSVNNKFIFYLVQNLTTSTTSKNSSAYQIFQIKELAYEKQISKLLTEDKYDDALLILNNNINSSDEDKPQKLESFFLDSAWTFLAKGNFIKAEKHFKLTNYDPMGLIMLFQNELKIKDKKIDNEIKMLLSEQKCSIETITSNNQDLIKAGLRMLCDLLVDKRNYLVGNFLKTYSGGDINKAKSSNFNIQFVHSSQALVNVNFGMNFNQLLSMINTAIIKIMVICKYKVSQIKEIVDHENFICNDEDITEFLTERLESKVDINNEAKIVFALLYEKKEKWDAALNIWQEFGHLRDSNIGLSYEAFERTKLILTKAKDADLLKEYIPWMLTKFPETAFKLFMKNELVPTDYFYTSIIGTIDSSNPDLNIKEKFLEFYLASGSTTERYHTMLCDLYIEKLTKNKKNEGVSDINALDLNSRAIYDKLEAQIKGSQYYNKVHILEKIKDSWMLDLEVYLYSQLMLHSDAISRLITQGCVDQNFDKVEKYCNESKGNKTELFGEMFKTLTNQYNLNLNAIPNCKSDKDKAILEKNVELFKKQMLNVLKKYGDSQKLDVFLVLEFLPGDWLLTEQVLYEYLVKVIKNSNHMSNKYKLAKSLSEMSLLYKEKELIEERNKSVSIGNNTLCESCKKKIGSTIFVVYPNMKIYHTKCANDLSVCPTTRVDFSKKICS